ISEATMQQVDAEIRRIIDQQYALARRLIEENRDKIETMAKALLEWETLDADQLDDIMAGNPPRPPKPSQSTQAPQPPQDSAPTAPATTPTQPAQET
ncbi:MAG: cell division protein FtsH, partial [Gallionella sp.]|nr:cell division protein FtsH [Gallionella sp.]